MAVETPDFVLESALAGADRIRRIRKTSAERLWSTKGKRAAVGSPQFLRKRFSEFSTVGPRAKRRRRPRAALEVLSELAGARVS